MARRRLLPLAALLVTGASLLPACGDSEGSSSQRPIVSDAGPIHVHGLGLNPKDGALFIATHTGLFRADKGEVKATRVGDRYQDTMGFAVVGPDQFLGSGHPDGRDNLPPFLGLIKSRDGGRSWQSISQLGKSDFHVLEARGRRIYGFGSNFQDREAQFLVSSDAGKTWTEERVPEPLISLAVHPTTADRLVASGKSEIHESRDGGKTWRPRASASGLVVWRSPRELIMVEQASGSVKSSSNGTQWREVGQVGGQPAAFEAERDGLYVALHDGAVKRSSDGGRSWAVRSRP